MAGDTNWAHYDWSSVDLRVDQMARTNADVRIITLNAAPVWMMGVAACDWAHVSTSRVLDANVAAWADYVHFVVQRYMARGVRYFQVWNELKGYWNATANAWDFAAYIRMYNAVWDRIKGDPATAGAQIGGPYATFTNHQNATWPHGHSTLTGPWGGIDPVVTAGYESFFADAHGYDFVAVDLTSGDDAGNHGGSYNPMGLPTTITYQYFHDVVAWVRARTDRPIVASEVYWGGASDWHTVTELLRTAGANLFLLWHATDGVAGRLVDTAGNLLELGNDWIAYRAAHPGV